MFSGFAGVVNERTKAPAIPANSVFMGFEITLAQSTIG
jgi:hypothetical protein